MTEDVHPDEGTGTHVDHSGCRRHQQEVEALRWQPEHAARLWQTNGQNFCNGFSSRLTLNVGSSLLRHSSSKSCLRSMKLMPASGLRSIKFTLRINGTRCRYRQWRGSARGELDSLFVLGPRVVCGDGEHYLLVARPALNLASSVWNTKKSCDDFISGICHSPAMSPNDGAENAGGSTGLAGTLRCVAELCDPGGSGYISLDRLIALGTEIVDSETQL
ncbi:hypothetical protein B566_EDAN016375 [Ephemera danica]|nr:hypothetical protein B566_EDAN016375 [Ephemera danica]